METTQKEKSMWRLLLTAVVSFILLYFGARGVLEMEGLSTGIRVAAALVPVPVFGWFLYLIIRALRGADELERRIQLEALAVAFPVTVMILLTLGLLELAIELNRDDWSYRHIWAYMPMLYFLGVYIARRRYS